LPDNVKYYHLLGAPYAVPLLHLQAANSEAQLDSKMWRHDVSFGDVSYVRVRLKGMNHMMQQNGPYAACQISCMSCDHSEKTHSNQSFAKFRKPTR
jgi:hypothetical protein